MFQRERSRPGESCASARSGRLLCREAVAILATKAPPAEVSEYRRWVLWLARAVAQAAGEGPETASRISPDEELLLAELGAALAGEPSLS